MRPFKLTLSSLALLLLLRAPALGQSPGAATVQYVGEAPATIADNTSRGTDAVNDALAGPAYSSSSASGASASSAASAPAGGVSAGGMSPGDAAEVDPATGSSATAGSGSVAAGDPEAAGVASEEGLASITELPETGGPPPAALISGALLVALGLMARRLAL